MVFLHLMESGHTFKTNDGGDPWSRTKCDTRQIGQDRIRGTLLPVDEGVGPVDSSLVRRFASPKVL